MTASKNVGIDLVSIKRFKQFKKNSSSSFLKKVFTEQEIAYCFQYKDSASHFAGIFAAKEAASKALGLRKFPFIELEIKHAKDGAPQVHERSGKKLPVLISISHEGGLAVAIALR